MTQFRCWGFALLSFSRTGHQTHFFSSTNHFWSRIPQSLCRRAGLEGEEELLTAPGSVAWKLPLPVPVSPLVAEVQGVGRIHLRYQ